MRSRSAFPFSSLVVSLVLLVIYACSNQGEGEICDIDAGNAGNDDCQSGLVCTSLSGVLGARCCPSDLTTAKTAVCSVSHGASANPAPPDSGGEEDAEASAGETSTAADAPAAPADAPEEPMLDAAPEVSADVGADASADASTDARADAGADGSTGSDSGSGG